MNDGLASAFVAMPHPGPRNSQTQWRTALRPEGMPGFPMPRCFPNGLSALRGRIRTPLLSLSNSSRSPGRTPSVRRMSRGTVIWPLLVIRACFCTATLLPFFSIILLTFGNSLWSREPASKRRPVFQVCGSCLTTFGLAHGREPKEQV